jgi:error-prone DNA polymerase
VECWHHGLPEERALVRALVPLARSAGVPWVVTNDVRYAEPAQRAVHDVLAALRHGRTLDAMGTRLHPNGEWYLKGPAAMRRAWRHAPAGAARERGHRRAVHVPHGAAPPHAAGVRRCRRA